MVLANTNPQLLRYFLVLIYDISKAKKWNFSVNPRRENVSYIHWKQPSDIHALILNVDGASKGNPSLTIVGGVLRLRDGTFIKESTHYLGDSCTNFFAEAMSVLIGISMVIEMDFSSFLIQSDSQAVVTLIQGSFLVPWRLGSILKQIHHLLSYPSITFILCMFTERQIKWWTIWKMDLHSYSYCQPSPIF